MPELLLSLRDCSIRIAKIKFLLFALNLFHHFYLAKPCVFALYLQILAHSIGNTVSELYGKPQVGKITILINQTWRWMDIGWSEESWDQLRASSVKSPQTLTVLTRSSCDFSRINIFQIVDCLCSISWALK